MPQDMERNTRLVDAIDGVLEELRYSEDEPVQAVRVADGREVVIVRANSMTVSRLYVAVSGDSVASFTLA